MREPKIEFPCDYPIKVLGVNEDSFSDDVVKVFKKHDDQAVVVGKRDSKAGKYIALTIQIVATGEAQLKAIFEELKEDERVRYVL